MDIALWVAQIVLAAAFLMAGVIKLTQPKEKLAERLGGWVDDFSEGHVKAIGALELLAAVGLVLPGITGIVPVLVPLAAVGSILIQIGAVAVLQRRGESQQIVTNLMFIGIAAFVAWGRFGGYRL